MERVQLVDLKSGSSTHELRGHAGSVLTCEWSAHQDSVLATGSSDNRAMLWDVRSAKTCLLALDQTNSQSSRNQGRAHDGSINALAFTSDGLSLLTFGTDCKLKVWNTLTGLREMVNFGKILNNSKNKQIAVTVDTDPPLVYVPSAGSILVYEVHTGVKVDTLLGHCSAVNTCVYHRHFHELYSGGNDRNVLLWTPDEYKEDQKVVEPMRLGLERPPHQPRRTLVATVDTWSSDEG